MIVIPQHLLRLMKPEDRKTFGAQGELTVETRERVIYADEREFQKEVSKYLRQMEIVHINPPMHKRSMLPAGWPDFTYSYRGLPVALECKVWGEKPRADQSLCHEEMRKSVSAWNVFVVYELREVQKIHRDIDALLASIP